MAINLRSQSQVTKEAFKFEQKKCKSITQREKRSYMNNVLSSTNQDHSQGKIRQFFIRSFKILNSNLKAIIDKDDKAISLEPCKKSTKWREYF